MGKKSFSIKPVKSSKRLWLLGLLVVALICGALSIYNMFAGAGQGIDDNGIFSVVFFASTGIIMILSGMIMMPVALVGVMMVILGLFLLVVSIRTLL